MFATEAVRIHILTVPPQSFQSTGSGIRGAVVEASTAAVSTAEAQAQVPSPTQLGVDLSPAAAALLEQEGAPEHWDAAGEASEAVADLQVRWQHEFAPPAAEDVQPASAGALPWVPAEQQRPRQRAYRVAAESSSDEESQDSLSSPWVDRASTPAALLPVPAAEASQGGALCSQPDAADACCGLVEDAPEAAGVQGALPEGHQIKQQPAAALLPVQAQQQPEVEAGLDGAGQQGAASSWCGPAEDTPEAGQVQEAQLQVQQLEEQQPAAALLPSQAQLQPKLEAEPRDAGQQGFASGWCGPAKEAAAAAEVQTAHSDGAQLAQQQPAAALLPLQAQLQTEDAANAGIAGGSPAEQPPMAVQHTSAPTVPLQQQREAPPQQQMADRKSVV